MERSNLLFLITLVVGLGVTYIAVDQAYSTGKATYLARCIDSDRGINYNVYGYVTYAGETYYDSCLSSSRLLERYCLFGRMRDRDYACPRGCADGACIFEPKVGCTNECSLRGVKQCYGDNCVPNVYNRSCKTYRICGNYDSDTCLEWSTTLNSCEGSCY